jgi:hypothetical protein
LFDPFGDRDPIVWDNICGRGFLCLSEIKIILPYVLIFGYFREQLAVSVCCYFLKFGFEKDADQGMLEVSNR